MDKPETDQNTGRPERGSRQPIFNAPAPVLGFAALLLILHGGFGLLDQAGQRDLIWQFALIPERLGALLPALQYPDGLSAALTFVSHAFLHGDWMHVGFNAAWIVAMGVPVWRAFGGDGAQPSDSERCFSAVPLRAGSPLSGSASRNRGP